LKIHIDSPALDFNWRWQKSKSIFRKFSECRWCSGGKLHSES